MKRLILLVSLVLALSFVTQQAQLNLPISEDLMYKMTISIDRLVLALQNFNTAYEDKVTLYRRINKAKDFFSQINRALAKYNNKVIGGGNRISGNTNFVVGNFNNVRGSNNWVFVSKFSGNVDGYLILQNWKVELDKGNYVIMDPRYAISYISDAKNRDLKQKYFTSRRMAFSWNDWNVPNDVVPTAPSIANSWISQPGYGAAATQFNQNFAANSGLNNLYNNIRSNFNFR